MGDDLSNKRSLSKIARPNACLTGRAGIFIRADFGDYAPRKLAALLFGLPVKT